MNSSHSTAIEWTHRPGTKGETWNPIRARNKATGAVGWHCEHVTEACRFCYAERQNVIGTRGGTKLPFKPGHRKDLDIFLDEKTLLKPLHWKAPRTIFVCSMTDLFGEWVSDEWLDRIFAVAALCPQHTFIVLTKRPERMRDYLWEPARPFQRIHIAAAIDPTPWRWVFDQKRAITPYNLYLQTRLPLPNVWCGCSVCDQPDADASVPVLLQTPAAIRFISYEPALGPVDFTRIRSECLGRIHALRGWYSYEPGVRIDHTRLNWIISGGESGPKARPFDVRYARQTIRQCKAAGVACFVKQLGGFVIDRNDAGFDGCDEKSWPEHIESEDRVDFEPYGYVDEAQGSLARIRLRDKKGGDWTEWPEDLRVREFPA